MSKCPDKNPLQRNGLSRFQRALAALHPEFIKVDERGIAEMMVFAQLLAKKGKLRYFDLEGNGDFGETWSELMDFNKQFKTTDILNELNTRSDFPPHYALFLVFLKLFFELQNDINTLTKRHLDFYYKEILQLSNKAPIADSVHLVFTLAKNATEQIIAQNTTFDAGKDALKLPLIYKNVGNITVNRATIGALRSVFINPIDKKVYYAPLANTQDGIAKPLDENNPSWNVFGPKPKPKITCGIADTGINFPTADIGFAIAAPVLLMKEGERRIALDITTANNPLSILAAFGLPANAVKFKIQLSGAKAWIEAGEITATFAANKITLNCTVAADEKEAVVPFNADVLEGGYKTNAPVMRCWLVQSEHYPILRGIQVAKIKAKVSVFNIKKTLTLENDLGKVNAEKPFMPFGPTPVVGSTLYVGCEEALDKTLETVTVTMPEWVGKPANLTTHYDVDNNFSHYGYQKTEDSFTADVEIINGNLKGDKVSNKRLFSSSIGHFKSGVTVPTAVAVGFNYLWNWSFGYSYYTGGYLKSGNSFISFDSKAVLGYLTNVIPKTVSDSLLKIVLKTDFGHAIFPKVLTEAIIHNTTLEHSHPLPNAPYSPVVRELLLNYTASTQEVDLLNTDFKKFAERDLQFFHLGVFGQQEEHIFYKNDLNFLNTNQKSVAYWLPQYADNGTFYVGLSGIGALESVAILFQMSEGSANPERPVPTVAWSVLCRNYWYPLSYEELLSDTTNNLLTSGIIKFYLPAETTTDNTLLDGGMVWLKAELIAPDGTSAPIDSICNCIALHTQAVEARYVDNGNEPAHYATPLAANSIKKARVSLEAIKKVEQPYASFGNKPQETDEAYYQRISERLRHKQRAITIWDYEHLVLETYPSVFKAKCLNHTQLTKSLPPTDPNRLIQSAPGYVTMVVVPDLRLQNAINPLEPKVDLNTLEQIKVFLTRHAGKLVSIETTNPDYEPVRLKFYVRFKRGYEYAVYRKVLNQDIIRYLSPWAYDSGADIPFGGTLEKSIIINFIERLGYVDVLHSFQLLSALDGFSYTGHEEINASNPMAVLVSCSQHDIFEFDEKVCP